MDELDEADKLPSTKPELPSSDLGRLEPLDEEVPLHQQLSKPQLYQSLTHYERRASPPPQPNKRLRKLRLARLSRLDESAKARVSRSVQTSHVKSWLHAHGYVVKADKLHPAVTRVIQEWFSLVDQDGSRTLEHRELLQALKEAQIPCSEATIREMIGLMDMNKDGVIGWDEFEVFMTEEFAAGKSLLSGEYLLPSGTSLNFGVMIGRLKRNKLLRDIMEDPNRRNRWASIASNPDALFRELATMQEAVDATSLTLDHLKRSEAAAAEAAGADGGGTAAMQAKLAAALARSVDSAEVEQRGGQAMEPLVARSLAERLRVGVLGQGQDRASTMGSAAAAAPPGDGPLSAGPVHRTPRGRACPDPTASPLTPTNSEGGASACGSLDMLMQSNGRYGNGRVGGGGVAVSEDFAAAAAAAGAGHYSGPGSNTTASAPVDGSGATVPYNVARYLASQHLGFGGRTPQSAAPLQPPSTPLAQQSSAPLDFSTCQGSRGVAPHRAPGLDTLNPQAAAAADASLLVASTSPVPGQPGLYDSRPPSDTPLLPPRLLKGASLPYTLYGDRRSCEVPYAAAAAGGAAPRTQLSVSPAAMSEPLPNTRAANRSASASGCWSVVAATGRGGRGSRSISPGASAGPPQQPVAESRYLAAQTASYRAHLRPSSRVIAQVGLLARELRAAPGRLFAEPPGLPAAVLAATRGPWGRAASGGVKNAEMSLNATIDGFGGYRSTLTSCGTGEPTAAAALPPPFPPKLTHRRASALNDLQSVASLPEPSPPPPGTLPARSQGSGCGSLPALPQYGGQYGQLPQFLEPVLGVRGMADSGDLVGPAARGSLGLGSVKSFQRAAASCLGEATIDGVTGGDGGADTAGRLTDVSLHAPRRLYATSAWDGPVTSLPPASPRGASAGAFAAALLSPRTSWPAKPMATAAGRAAVADTATSTERSLKPGSTLTAMRECAGDVGSYADGANGDDGGSPLCSRAQRNYSPRHQRCTVSPIERRAADSHDDRGRDWSTVGGVPNAAAMGSPPRWDLGDTAADRPSGGGGKGMYGRERHHGGAHATADARSRRSPRSLSPVGGGGAGTARAERTQSRARAEGTGLGVGDDGVQRAMGRQEAAAALSAALRDALPQRGTAARPASSGLLGPQSPCGAATLDSTSTYNTGCSPLLTVPALLDGCTGDADSVTAGRGAGGGPGRAALGLLGPAVARPLSRARSPLGTARGDREEDPTGDPGWHATAASLLQLHISQQLVQ